MTPTFRLFLSSPGDAQVERRRAENVVSRLNGEFSGLARLQTLRWETEYYRAHSTFQSQIPPACDCDIVVGVLKWRLGTELPPDFAARLPSGDSYPSGTAFEILTAIDKRRAGADLPDVFVFRYVGGSPNPPLDDPNRVAIERDWGRLRSFFERWFVTPQGHFIAALNNYASEDQFESELEKLLRKWLAEKVAGGRTVAWPASKGSPFRGLSVFSAKHAPVFFGRAADVRRAVDLWREAAARGTPFLLIVGASGAGKSSLARAGAIARITTPGVAPDVDLWRVAIMRPGDSPDGPFAALAAALLQDASSLPSEEEGRGSALPEIAEGDCKTPAELAALLAHADAAATRPIVNALARIGERARNDDRYRREVSARLVLLVDQLDELFAASISASTRARFADLLALLVATGRVWLLGTLRADLYASMLEIETLKRLKDAGASYDLGPPGAAELAEIVRAPAAAAGLVFESDAATGERLDERLLREADRPDMLPLVQLALSRLWEARETRAGETILPLGAYAKLGGLAGIIDEAGETALAGVGEAERARLPALLRRLAEFSRGPAGGAPTPTARAAPLAEAAADAPAKTLVDALVAARLLTLWGRDETTQLRLSHQRVLSDWSRAAAIVAESADFYRIRDAVEDQRRRWEEGKRRSELLVARGLPLAEAQSVVAKYGAELSPETRAFVAASRRRAQRAQVIGWGLAAVFALLALGAGAAAKIAIDQRSLAQEQRARADRNFAAAKQTVDGLIFNIAEGLRNVSGMRVATIRSILDTAQHTVDALLQTAPEDPQLLRSEAGMWSNFATTYQAAGDLKDASEAAARSLDFARKLAAERPDDADAQESLVKGFEAVGEAKQQAGDEAAALVAYEEALTQASALAARNPQDADAQRLEATGLQDVGAVKQQQGDRAGALADYQQALDAIRKLAGRAPQDPQAQRALATALLDVGDGERVAGDYSGALASYQQALPIARKLGEQNPADTSAQRSVANLLNDIGRSKQMLGDSAGALAAREAVLTIARKLAAQDPGNAAWRRAVALALEEIGEAKMAAGDPKGALAAYQEALGVASAVAAQDKGDADAQIAVIAALEGIGAVKLKGGDKAGSLAAYEQAGDRAHQLAAQDPHNLEARHHELLAFDQIGDVKLAEGDRAGAIVAYRQDIDMARQLAVADGGNLQAQDRIWLNLEKIGDINLDSGDLVAGRAAYRQALTLAESLAAKRSDLLAKEAAAYMRLKLGMLSEFALFNQLAVAGRQSFPARFAAGPAIVSQHPKGGIAEVTFSIALPDLGLQGDVVFRFYRTSAQAAAYLAAPFVAEATADAKRPVVSATATKNANGLQIQYRAAFSAADEHGLAWIRVAGAGIRPQGDATPADSPIGDVVEIGTFQPKAAGVANKADQKTLDATFEQMTILYGAVLQAASAATAG